MIQNINKNSAGFTLVEMLVVCAVFSIIIMAISGVFVSAIRTQKYSLVTQQLLNQTSYSMEYMSRSLRMAKKNTGTTLCSAVPIGQNYTKTATGIAFLDAQNRCKSFWISSQLFDDDSSRNPVTLPLTSSNISVNSFNINLSGESQVDTLQPRVTFFLELEGQGVSGTKPKIRIQTTVSQRDLDIIE